MVAMRGLKAYSGHTHRYTDTHTHTHTHLHTQTDKTSTIYKMYTHSRRTEDVEGDCITDCLVEQCVSGATRVYLAVIFNTRSDDQPADGRPAAVLGRHRSAVVDAVHHLITVLPPRQSRRRVRRWAHTRDNQRLTGFHHWRTQAYVQWLGWNCTPVTISL